MGLFSRLAERGAFSPRPQTPAMVPKDRGIGGRVRRQPEEEEESVQPFRLSRQEEEEDEAQAVRREVEEEEEEVRPLRRQAEEGEEEEARPLRLRREAEEEEEGVQALRRQAAEDEEAQPFRLRRQAEEEEEAQPLRRQEAENEETEEARPARLRREEQEEEEEVQALRRQAEPEEEAVQAWSVQRNARPDDPDLDPANGPPADLPVTDEDEPNPLMALRREPAMSETGSGMSGAGGYEPAPAGHSPGLDEPAGAGEAQESFEPHSLVPGSLSSLVGGPGALPAGTGHDVVIEQVDVLIHEQAAAPAPPFSDRRRIMRARYLKRL